MSTAIKRKSISSPTRYLVNKNLILGHTLDYGCGHGVDANYLHCERHDPVYYPHMPSGQFYTIICNYVLNVIEDLEERNQVLQTIFNKLSPGGTAYITVRADVKKDGPTTRGWQGNIDLPLPIEHQCRWYRMYRLTKPEGDWKIAEQPAGTIHGFKWEATENNGEPSIFGETVPDLLENMQLAEKL